MAAVLWHGSPGARERLPLPCLCPLAPVQLGSCGAGTLDLCCPLSLRFSGPEVRWESQFPEARAAEGPEFQGPLGPNRQVSVSPNPPPAPTLGTANRVLGRREGQLSFLPRWRPELSGLAQGSLRGAGKVFAGPCFHPGPPAGPRVQSGL